MDAMGIVICICKWSFQIPNQPGLGINLEQKRRSLPKQKGIIPFIGDKMQHNLSWMFMRVSWIAVVKSYQRKVTNHNL